MKKTNKLLALLLAAVLVLGMLPVPAAHAHVHTHGWEEYPVLQVDTLTDAVVTEAGTYAYLSFTPLETDVYHFYSQSESDTYGVLYNADLIELAYNDDANYGNEAGVYAPNFCISHVLESGTTYVFGVRLYSNAAATIPVMLSRGHDYVSEVTKEATCAEDGVLTYTCTHCGDSYTEAIPAAHEYDEETGKCIFCDEDYQIGGQCGEKVTWSMDYFGNLVISGTGDMYNYIKTYGENYPAPWYDYSYSIKSITVEEGVTSVGNYAFYYCGEAKEITLAETVTKLGTHAFMNCSLVESIVLPNGITEIPDSCFKYCGSLEDIIWPANLTTIGDNAFNRCNLGDVVVPEGVTSLGQYAFGGNSSLTKLSLPATLTTVADYAFSDMYSIRQFVFTGDAPSFGAKSFNYITADAWYPMDNATWTDEVKQSYGGTITWYGMCEEHTWDAPVTVPATCDTGSYMTMTCTVCGWTEVSPENDDALGHVLIETVIEPDCSQYINGCTEITCQREGCDYYDAKDYKYYWEYHDNETVTVEATCTTDGYTKNICRKCGNEEWLDYFNATGHNVTDWSEPTAATCTEDGIKSGTCANCSETIVEVVETALGHEWNLEAGTENADGTTTYPCIRCDATYTTEGAYLYEGDNQFTIKADANTAAKTYTAAADGTLTIYLSDLFYLNTNTGEWSTMAIDWFVKTEGAISISVNGENAGFTVEGSETAAKLILNPIQVKKDDVVTVELAHTSASWLDGTDVRFNVNLALATSSHTHNYVAVVTAPTCTEKGYTTYTCECGDSYIADETPALGHTMEERIGVATCTEPGWIGGECTVCGYVEIEYTEPALGHDYTAVVTEPTCTEEGFTTHTCTRCSDSYVDTQTEALGHDWKGTACQRCDATRENPFTDVPEDSFYIDAVLWAVEKGITTGATPTTFNPTGDLLRAQVVTMLWRAAGEPAVDDSVDNPFDDVKPGDWYYDAVLWAVEQGITTGTTPTTFSPTGKTNRAQALTFLWRSLGEPAGSATNSFEDVVPGLWYEAPINWAVGAGVTNGISATKFGINDNCNRAAMVTFLYRADKLGEQEEENEGTDPVEPVQKYMVDFRDDGNGTVICDVTEAAPGEKVTFTATPKEGYYFSDFVIFDPNKEIDTSKIEVFEGEGEHEYYVYMIEYPLIVTCRFKPIPNE